MGLFSEVINSCQDLGPEFLGVLQTKDLESMMDTYWLAPDGHLYRINDDSTWTLAEDAFETIPTGLRGRVEPYRIYGRVRFTDGPHEAVAWFEDGLLKQVLCAGPAFSCERVDRRPHWS